MPDQPFRVDDLGFHRLPFHRVDHLAAEHGTLSRRQLHRDVKPVEDPAPSQLTALNRLPKFTGVVADHGHAFIARHTVPAGELIESRCSRSYFLVLAPF
jgi:hypothetical protein